MLGVRNNIWDQTFCAIELSLQLESRGEARRTQAKIVTKICFERCLCVGNVSISHRGSFVLLSFYGELLVIYRFSSNFSCLYLGTSHFGRPPVFRKFPWCQIFPRSHKHLKGQKLLHLKSFYKILL